MLADAKLSANSAGRIESGLFKSYSGVSQQDQEPTLAETVVAKSHFDPGVIRVVSPLFSESCVAADQRRLCSLPGWQSFVA